MAYTNHDLVYGRVVSEVYKNPEPVKQLIAVLSLLAENRQGKPEGLTVYYSHDDDARSFSVGIRLGELNPWGFEGLHELKTMPTEAQLAEHERVLHAVLSQMQEDAKALLLERPLGVWFVASAN